MLCGYLKQTCKSISVEELINLLQLCKNKKASIKVNGMSSFYIHFDQDGQFIDLTKQSLSDQYGENGADNTCNSCRLCDKASGACRCNGEGCLNAESMIETEKYNNPPSVKSTTSTDTKSEEATVVLETKVASTEANRNGRSYDLSMFTINGNGSEGTPEVVVEDVGDKRVEELIKESETTSPVLEVPKQKPIEEPLDSNVIKKVINDAIADTLTKMINSIKE